MKLHMGYIARDPHTMPYMMHVVEMWLGQEEESDKVFGSRQFM